jgi:hypothetical protein
MLEVFMDWFIKNYKNMLERSYKPEFHVSFFSPEKPGGYIRVETKKFLGEFDFWETGECEIQIINIDTGTITLGDYSILLSGDEIRKHLDSFLRQFFEDEES